MYLEEVINYRLKLINFVLDGYVIDPRQIIK